MRTLVAILALSPALLHAQAKSPAQPVSTPSVTSTLQSKLVAPALLASEPGTTPLSVRTTTGVTPAHLIHIANLEESSFALPFLTVNRTIVIAMTVDKTGKPQDLHLTKPADPFTNREVLDAVARFRYQPATVGGVPVDEPVNLILTISR